MKERLSNWEHELWNYVSSGDGDTCPIYNFCQARLGGSWCASDQKNHLDRIVDTILFGSSQYDFIEGIRPGRIFELVEMLAQKYLKMGKVTSPPVPDSLVELADLERDVEVRLVPLEAYHGALWLHDDTWIIQLNKNDTMARRRLTLFHESFHILAHCKATPVFRKINSDKGSFNELLAENFAHHILMPTQWVQEKWAEFKDPGILAKIFDVPETAMVLRLRSLRLI
jgi:Zn-dependent peptidase ImmA (M78 family)